MCTAQLVFDRLVSFRLVASPSFLSSLHLTSFTSPPCARDCTVHTVHPSTLTTVCTISLLCQPPFNYPFGAKKNIYPPTYLSPRTHWPFLNFLIASHSSYGHDFNPFPHKLERTQSTEVYPPTVVLDLSPHALFQPSSLISFYSPAAASTWTLTSAPIVAQTLRYTTHCAIEPYDQPLSYRLRPLSSPTHLCTTLLSRTALR